MVSQLPHQFPERRRSLSQEQLRPVPFPAPEVLTENLTIVNCQVSGFEEGTLLDGTMKLKRQSLWPH